MVIKTLIYDIYAHIAEGIHILSIRVDSWCRKALVILSIVMVTVIGAQVFCRYALNNSLFWSEEIGRIILVWLSFTGASVAFRARAHIGVDSLWRKLSEKWRKIATFLMLIACAVFFGVMLYWGTLFSIMLSTQTTASLGIPKQYPFLIIPLSGGIMLLHTVAMTLDVLTGNAK